ncbi:MAG: hypothetical protein R3C29_04460 [Dehalococcoidia bacterium]
MPDKVIAGAKVVTSDGKELGTVKEAEDRAFHVDAPRQFDYWLQSSVVKSASADIVVLTIAESELSAYKMDNAHDPDAFQEKIPRELDPDKVRADRMDRGQPF